MPYKIKKYEKLLQSLSFGKVCLANALIIWEELLSRLTKVLHLFRSQGCWFKP